jgi:hypothetical protein
MTELTAAVRTTGNLDAGLVSSMYRLYDRYYGAASETAFRRDLRAKDKVILLRDRAGELQGFSTLAVTEFDFNRRAHRAIFSGDTIIDRRHWGEHALAFAWIELAGSIKREAPDVPLYWFLIVKGVRTFRYLPVFARRFYPHWEVPTPAREQRLLDMLAIARFSDAYDPRRGVISFPRSRGHLRSEFAEVPVQQFDRPEVRFFLERNPGYRRGDELACLTELHADNLRPMARRLFSKGMAA